MVIFTGYKPGVFGYRNGPVCEFDALIHEVSYSIYIALKTEYWRLDIINYRYVGTPEPSTMHSTQLECEVFGIQYNILSHFKNIDKKQYAHEKAVMLHDFMPNWMFGGQTDQHRMSTRKQLIEKCNNKV